jgi:D-alanyl-D-alanine dipeptidase
MSIDKNAVYKLLEEKMLNYKDYTDIPVIPEEDEVGFIPVRSSAVLSVNSINDDTTRLTGDEVLLRSAVADRLYWAGQELKTFDKDLRLEIVYGYRALEVQQALFDQAKDELSAEYNDPQELIEAVHRRIAVPDVAGHPTGGAVDVQVLRNEVPVEMGTPIWDFSRESFTFSPFISREAWENRQLLRRAMMAAGFAPFDGEWWHFSYGDKEWARYYDRPGALYDQVAVKEVRTRKDADILS